MASFPFREITVIEIEITDECRIVKCSPVRCCFTAADQRGMWFPSEILNMFSDRLYRCALQGTDRRTERVKKDRKSTRLNSSHVAISYAVFCLKKKNTTHNTTS